MFYVYHRKIMRIKIVWMSCDKQIFKLCIPGNRGRWPLMQRSRSHVVAIWETLWLTARWLLMNFWKGRKWEEMRFGGHKTRHLCIIYIGLDFQYHYLYTWRDFLWACDQIPSKLLLAECWGRDCGGDGTAEGQRLTLGPWMRPDGDPTRNIDIADLGCNFLYHTCIFVLMSAT